MQFEHRSNFPGGKSAIEFTLPVEIASIQDLNLHGLNRVAENDLVSRDSVRRIWEERSSNLQFEMAQRLFQSIDELEPFSLVLVDSEWWICFQESSKVENRGMFFLVPFLPPIAELQSFPISNHPEMWECLNIFRTLSSMIPPLLSNWGQKFDGTASIVEKASENWGQIGSEWEGALISPLPPTDLSGDCLLYSLQGKFGLWHPDNLFTSRPMVTYRPKTKVLQEILEGGAH